MRLQNRADSGNTTALPKPFVVPTSGDYEGNDGKWSTFSINIGDSDGTGRGQTFKVLISTSSPVTIVPGPSEWCSQDCSAQRGVQIFNNNQPTGLDPLSPSWKAAGIYDIPIPDWWSLNTINGLYGFDYVGMGVSSMKSVILRNQYVALSGNQSLFMGSLGLANSKIAVGQGDAQQPFLENFYQTYNPFDPAVRLIPSSSYGYTAGASYRNNGNGVRGSLVLGGYDKSRVNINGKVSIAMPSDQNTTLRVGVPSILYTPKQGVEQNGFSLTSNKGFYAMIDSTFPYLVLPDDVVDNFAKKFQLKHDNATDLYLIDSSAQNFNEQQNANVTFKIRRDSADSASADDYASIVLPYDAFNLEMSSLTGNKTKYFPIKKSRNGVFVLGRAFLQEAYIIVDYERTNFTVAPAAFSDEQNIVTIFNKTTDLRSTLIPQPGNKSLSPGAIAGIVVGILLFFLLAALGAFFWWKKHRKDQPLPPYTEKPAEMETHVAGTEVKHRRVSELDSGPNSAYGSPKPSLGGFYGGDRDKNISPFPPISEMESPPAELYSPPMGSATPHSEGAGSDYFISGDKVRRRGATRESSEVNTPGTSAAIAELPGDDGQYQVGGVHFEPVASPKLSHTRGPSDTSLHSKIDEVVAGSREPSQDRSGTPLGDLKSEGSQNVLGKVNEEGEDAPASGERRPSHTRGLSDTTVQSDDTAVSALTPEEMEQWAMAQDNESRRPLSE